MAKLRNSSNGDAIESPAFYRTPQIVWHSVVKYYISAFVLLYAKLILCTRPRAQPVNVHIRLIPPGVLTSSTFNGQFGNNVNGCGEINIYIRRSC